MQAVFKGGHWVDTYTFWLNEKILYFYPKNKRYKNCLTNEKSADMAT